MSLAEIVAIEMLKHERDRRDLPITHVVFHEKDGMEGMQLATSENEALELGRPEDDDQLWEINELIEEIQHQSEKD